MSALCADKNISEVRAMKQIIKCRDGKCKEYLIAENDEEIPELVFHLTSY